MKKKTNNIILNIMTGLCVIILGFSAYKLITLYNEYNAGTKEYKSVREKVVKEIQPVNNTSDIIEATIENPPLEINWDELKAINSDVVGWIYIDAIPSISYPILKTDNNDYYLHHTIEKNYNFAGSIFMESLNKPDFSDKNTIIYGHNMKNGSMFAMIKKLLEQDAVDENPYFWILTPEINYKYEIFSAFRTAPKTEPYKIGFIDNAEFKQWQDYLINNSVISCNKNVTIDDKFVMLSTCYQHTNRTVVIGKLCAKV